MKKLIIFISIFIILLTISVNYYFEYIGLGDPIRYDKDFVYGYAPKADQKKKRLKQSFVTINESGLRSIESWKNSKKKKILFIGDSVTYGGSYIDDKEIFSHLVCDELKRFTCGNAGVNAYGIINMVHRSKYDERIFDADIVIFLFSGFNFTREYAGSDIAHFYLNRDSFFLPGLMEAISFIFTKYDINNFLSKKNDTEKYDHKKELIDYSLKLLVSETERLKRENKVVKIFYTIEKDDMQSKRLNNQYILNNLKSLDFDNFYSLENILIKDDYFVDNVHLSHKGHAVVAEKIISIISSN